MKKQILSLLMVCALAVTLLPAASAVTAAKDEQYITLAEAQSMFGIEVSPSHITFPATPIHGDGGIEVVTLTNNGSAPIMIRGNGDISFPDSAKPNLYDRMDLLIDSTLYPGDSVDFRIELMTGQAGSGSVTGSLALRINPSSYVHVGPDGIGVGATGTHITITDFVTVDYEVLEEGVAMSNEGFSVSTDELDFGAVEASGDTGIVTVTNTGTYPFLLNTSVDDSYHFSVDVQAKEMSLVNPGETVTIEVTTRVSGSTREISGEMTIRARYDSRTGAPEDYTVEKVIPLTMTYLKDGGYYITYKYDRGVDYGTITNADGAPYYGLSITGVEPGSDFTVYFRPKADCHILNVCIDGENMGAIDHYTFTNVQDNHDIEMIFGQGKGPSPWAAEQVTEAVQLGLVSWGLRDYDQPTTREDFCQLAAELYEEATGKRLTGWNDRQFTDTANTSVQAMAALGVVNGVGGGKFNPTGTLTREQAATILVRLADAMGYPLPEGTANFADNASISSWARDAVGRVQAGGIMDGVGGNAFNPKAVYSREQSILTILRLYQFTQS